MKYPREYSVQIHNLWIKGVAVNITKASNKMAAFLNASLLLAQTHEYYTSVTTDVFIFTLTPKSTPRVGT